MPASLMPMRSSRTLAGKTLANTALWTSVLLVLNFSAGCRSAFVEAAIRNDTAQPVTLVEVDYPSASFGKEMISPGENFHYRFKILGSGSTKVLWTDAGHHEHTVGGPELHEGQQGNLQIAIKPGTATWIATLQ